MAGWGRTAEGNQRFITTFRPSSILKRFCSIEIACEATNLEIDQIFASVGPES
jgi:hypothetical protein